METIANTIITKGTSLLPCEPFYFIRHGQTDWNKNNIWMGQKDLPLNQHGKEQGANAAQALKKYAFNTIVTSPLKRAHETADIIAQTIQVPLFIIDTLQECSWGIKEGQKATETAWIQQWREGTYTIEGGETFAAFEKRVLEGLQRALQFPKPLLIVAHGGVYWVIQKIFEQPYYDIHNCSVLRHIPGTGCHCTWTIDTVYTL